MNAHLAIAPLLVPFVAGIALLALPRMPFALERAVSLLAVLAQAGIAVALAGCRGAGRHPRLPARRLAGALGHRAGGRPPGRRDGADHHAAGAVRRDPCRRRRRPARTALPRAVPAAAVRPGGRLSHRRPVQPLRVLRSAADRLLRAAAARRRRRSHARRAALRGAEPARFDGVPVRGGAALRHAGQPEPRRPRAEGRSLPPRDAGLARAGGLLLLAVFGLKAALLPLHLWLPRPMPAPPRRWRRCSRS